MADKRTLIVLLGPTGVGKTDLAITIAHHLGAPIISTDSRQVFRGMAIGTAQPTAEQLASVPHYFIADREIDAEYNAGIFEKEALERVGFLFKNHRYVLSVGGSGLYIDALCDGFDTFPTTDVKLREKLENKSLAELQNQLQLIDPEYFTIIDKSNPARVRRAVEVCLITGRKYSEQRSGKSAERAFEIIKIGLTMPREELYSRINRRVDEMMAAGLEAEARALYPKRGLNALQTVGYKELWGYFEGQTMLEEAVELIKRNSRRYAKRQMTWFRKYTDIQWFTKKDDDLFEKIVEKFGW